MTDLERLARAGFEAGVKWPDSPLHLPADVNLKDISITGKVDLIAWTAAILTELLEPTEGMIEAGAVEILSCEDAPPEFTAKAVFRAMIDHIIEGR